MKLRYWIGKKWAHIEEDNGSEFPLQAEVETFDMTETEIFLELVSAFFDDSEPDVFGDGPDYSAADCEFIRDYDENIIRNLS